MGAKLVFFIYITSALGVFICFLVTLKKITWQDLMEYCFI